VSRVTSSCGVQSAYETTTPRATRDAWPAPCPATGTARLDAGGAGRAAGGLTRGGLALRDGTGATERADDRATSRPVQTGAARTSCRDELPRGKGRASSPGRLPIHRG